jgi:histidinol-phosphate aminotransferase
MLPTHFDLDFSIRPNVRAIPAYITSTSDEHKPRTAILLDANENALGSCLAPTSPYRPQNGFYKGLSSCDDSHMPSTPYHSNGNVFVKNGSVKSRVAAINQQAVKFSESTSLHRYPSASQFQLKRAIADWRGHFEPQNLCLGVGAADIVDLVIRTTCSPGKDAVMTTPPTFGLYKVRAALNDIEVVSVPLQTVGDDFSLDTDCILESLSNNRNIKLLFLVSPGNPTGTLIPLSDMKRILDFKGVLNTINSTQT